MSTNRPETIAESNLSHAWGQAFLQVMRADSDHAPITLSVESFDAMGLPFEDPVIRQAVDAALEKHKRYCVRKTAYTIFPDSAWEFQGQPPHHKFGPMFRKWIFPPMYRSLKANRCGTYFQRIVAFGAKIDKQVGSLSTDHIDQIEKILKFWKRKGSHRRSAMQAACFDPHRDHHMKPRSGFPCLHQVSFSHNSRGELAITGYYPSEYIFDRGYGNYLGLCHLGRYMAKNMGLRLVRMNCVIGHPLLGGEGIAKTPLRTLEKLIQSRIAAAAATPPPNPIPNAILVERTTPTAVAS